MASKPKIKITKVTNRGVRPLDPRSHLRRNLDIPEKPAPRPPIVRPPRPSDPRPMVARIVDFPTDEWDLEAAKAEIVEHLVEPPKRVLRKVKSTYVAVKGHIFSHGTPATTLPNEAMMRSTQSLHSYHSNMHFADAVAEARANSTSDLETDGPTHGGVAVEAALGVDSGSATFAADIDEHNRRVRDSWIALDANPGDLVRSIYVDDGDRPGEVTVVQQQGYKSIHVPGYDRGLGNHRNQTGRLPSPATSTESLQPAYKLQWQMTGLTELINNSLADITNAMALDPEGVQRVRAASGELVPLASVHDSLLDFKVYYNEFLSHGGLLGNRVMGGEAFLLAMVAKRSEINNGTLELIKFKECEK